MNKLIDGYLSFLDNGKTERRCATEIIKQAEEAGYKSIDSYKSLKAGDRVYICKMGKAVMLFDIGSEDISNGMNILGAHIDSPRLDVKQNPVYEKSGIVYLNTHYYGGIKKYQWLAMPLAINGFVFLKNGKKIDINVGDDPEDPVFCISDILPHIAQKQMEKTASEFIEGENLDLIIGVGPEAKDGETDPNKNRIISIFKEKYGFDEADFGSAELEVVPAGKARDMGVDRSMILGYGHDDRVCSYPTFEAVCRAKKPKRTVCGLLVDKEEIGSVGATGMNSRFFENTVAELINLNGDYSDILLRRALSNSYAISSDVSGAYDSIYASAFEKKNSAYLGRGFAVNKYTGARGKSGSNDASAEYMGKIRSIFEAENVYYQTCALGKVDQGGGGTIAYIFGNYNMNVIDGGVAVLSMHAPFEVISKVDLYEAYRAYVAFAQNA